MDSLFAVLQFIVHHSQHTLYLCQSQHTPMEGVACIVTLVLIAQHGAAMVYPHWQVGIFFLKDADQVN